MTTMVFVVACWRFSHGLQVQTLTHNRKLQPDVVWKSAECVGRIVMKFAKYSTHIHFGFTTFEHSHNVPQRSHARTEQFQSAHIAEDINRSSAVYNSRARTVCAVSHAAQRSEPNGEVWWYVFAFCLNKSRPQTRGGHNDVNYRHNGRNLMRMKHVRSAIIHPSTHSWHKMVIGVIITISPTRLVSERFYARTSLQCYK